MTFFKRFLSLLALVSLTSCGGGGSNAGSSGFTSAGGTTTAASAADLIVSASAAQLPNLASASVTVTVTAVDSNRVVVANVPVQLAADNDAVIAQSATTTDASGKLSGTVSVGANRANRVITVTAKTGSLSKTLTVEVVGAAVSSTLVPAVVSPGATGQVQYRVSDQAGSAMSNQAVQVSATGLTPATATGTTDGNGAYVFSYTAPTTAGSYQILTTIDGVTDTQTVSVQATSTVPAAVGPVSSASVSANPSVVGVNATGAATTNRAEIRALFVGAGNVAIPNVRVRLTLPDPNAVGGSFSTGSSILYSDANGVVTSAYIPGTRSSPTDGVIVRACYGLTDTDPNLVNCTTYADVKLTVTSQPLGVSVGTNGLVIVNNLTYTKQFVVTVVDSAGNAMSGVPLSVSLDLRNYYKGQYTVSGSSWSKVSNTQCANEDTNRNGVLDSGEDINGDGKLEPGIADAQVQLLNPTTGSDGTAVVQVTYAQSFGSWIDVLLTVSASGVSGTEGRASYLLQPVPVPSTTLTTTSSSPAFQVSPYGVASSCSNPN